MDTSNMTTSEMLKFATENEHRVYEAGKKQGVYEWWDKYQSVNESYDRTDFMYAFAGVCWDDEVYNPLRQINATTRSTNMFAYSNVTNTKVPINIAGSTDTNKGGTFQNAVNMVTVELFIVNEKQAMHEQVKSCSKLQNLTIEGTIGRNANFQWCPLTKESIESVFDHLGTLTATQTVTFKGSAVDAAFETSEGAKDGRTSSDWSALVEKAETKKWSVLLYDE